MRINQNSFAKYTGIIRVFIITAPLLLTAPVTGAHDYRIGSISIDHPRAMPLPPASPNGAVYLTISNEGDTAVRLVGGSTPIAGKVEIHTHVHEDGQMKMQHLEAGLEIAGGEIAEFVPGRLHLMLMGLEQPLVEGESFPITLEFDQAGSIDTVVHIETGHSTEPHH